VIPDTLNDLIELLTEADKKVGGVMVELTVRTEPRHNGGVPVGRVLYGMKQASRSFDGTYELKQILTKLAK
jgi:hypothetical protein